MFPFILSASTSGFFGNKFITGIKFILKSAKNPRKLIKEIGIDEFELI